MPKPEKLSAKEEQIRRNKDNPVMFIPVTLIEVAKISLQLEFSCYWVEQFNRCDIPFPVIGLWGIARQEENRECKEDTKG